MVSTIDEARTPAELAEWLRLWANGYEDGDALDDNDARQIADAVERVCALCNAAAMREALKEIISATYDIDRGCPDYRNIARAALAAPPRNCDRFATANDAVEGYIAAHPHDDEPDASTYGSWLFAPAQEEKEARRG